MKTVIEMAREAGVQVRGFYDDEGVFPSVLNDFAALVAAAEREACARVCDAEDGDTLHDQTDCTWSKAARHCAAAIRARGEK